MKYYPVLSSLFLMLLSNGASAYVPNMGGSGGGGACAKPKFSHFMPAAKGEAKPNSIFSFVASPNTHPKSIKVTVKDIPVEVNTSSKMENAFKVTGSLPASLKNTFARISISGESSGQCKGAEGWLIKITE
ncbi:MAG: hypothetical protein ABL903_02325 [Methylococcales bacterium]